MDIEDIHSADRLISWVEEENARILDEESEAYVVIVKRDKKNNVLYAQELDFPMDSDMDFDSLLDKFYSRKPISFDHSLLEGSVKTTFQSMPVPPTPQMPVVPPIVEGYAQVPNIQSEIEEQEENQEVEKSELQQLIKVQQEQQEELKRMKKQLEERQAALEAKELEQQSQPSHSKEKALTQAVSVDVPSASKRLDVKPLVEVVTDEETFQERMTRFLAQEQQKVEAEIASYDQRSFIESDIMEKVTKEKEEALHQFEVELFEKQTADFEREEQRHTNEMKKISETYDQRFASKQKVIEENYQKQATKDIQVEYARQTKELKQLFDERMIAIKKNQSELAAGLMGTFKSTFERLDLETTQENEGEKEEHSDDSLKPQYEVVRKAQ